MTTGYKSLCCTVLSHSVLCNSLQPHILYPTRLLCSWGFSRQECCVGLPCPPPGDLPNPRIESTFPTLWVNSLTSEPPGKPKNTGVGSLSLLQGIFPTQGSNTDLPHCRWTLDRLSHKGNPRILGWVAYPFSSGSSQPRNQTGVSLQADSLPTELSGKHSMK